MFSGRFIFTKVFIEPKRSKLFCSFFSQSVGLHMLIGKMEQTLAVNTYIFRYNGRNGLTWAIYVCFLMISDLPTPPTENQGQLTKKSLKIRDICQKSGTPDAL